jgi:hypothetical protein
MKIAETMKYKDLLKALQKMPKEKLEDTVVVLDPVNDEYFPVESMEINKFDDVLHAGDYFIRMVE